MGRTAQIIDSDSTQRISRKWQRQLTALQARNDRTVSKLDSACDTLRRLETEIEFFLDDYYGRVGASIEQLRQLEQEITQLSGEAAEPVKNQDAPDAPLPGLDRDLKTLYRALAMQCHPDIAGEEAHNARAIRNLNDAYAKRNIGELWRIGRELDLTNKDLSATERLTRLKAHCERMQQTLEAVETRRMALEVSPAYALMQRAFHYRLCGQDFIENVQSHIKSQIEEAKRQLVRMQLQELSEMRQTG